jgi:hypothetical protein
MEIKTRFLAVAWWTTLAISCGAAWAQDTKRVPDLNQGVVQGVEPVDASVHADVSEIPPEDPQPPQAPVKPTPTYSRWGFAPARQPGATQAPPAHASTATPGAAPSDKKNALPSRLPPDSPSFQAGGQTLPFTSWSARPADRTLDSEDDANSGNSAPKPSPVNNIVTGPTPNGPAGSEPSKAGATPFAHQPQSGRFSTIPSPQPDADGLSRPFSQQPQADGFSTPFPQRSQTGGFPTPFSQQQADGFSTPFSPKQLESNTTPHASSRAQPQTSSSRNRKRAPATQQNHSQKTLGSNHGGTVGGFHSKTDGPVRSPLSNKVE